MKKQQKKSKEQNRLICIVMLAVILLCPVFSYASFSDIEGYWGGDVILNWTNKGLAKGYNDGTFRPKNEITRAEFMSLINNAFGFTEEVDIDFKDVLEGKWYLSTIKKSKAAGYINGYEDGTIRPDKLITREEVASIIAKMTNLNQYEEGSKMFKDQERMKWSRGYIGAVANEKYMAGYPDGNFKPLNNITRGEAIFALDNIINKAGIQIIAKQDFLGITYIHVIWNKESQPLKVIANGNELKFDKDDGKWKGTSLYLNIGDGVEITAIGNGMEYRKTVFVKDIAD